MAIQLHCYDCSLDLAANAKRCNNCGLEALVGAGSTLDSGNDEYTIDRIIGRGGMGIAYLAANLNGDDVVVKQLFEDSDPATHADNLLRFKREGRIQASISHPRFPTGFGYFEESGIHFMAMEFCPGNDLDKLITTIKPAKKLTAEETLEIGVQLCEGLLVLHTHTDPSNANPDPIVHRDIKPGNIILMPNGEIKILDMGIARKQQQSAGTVARQTGSLGTVVYCAPEQLLQQPTIKSDQYSAAATLYHIVLGYTLPEVFAQRAAKIDDLPQTWQPAFRRALDNDETLRFPSVKEFQIELAKLLPATLQTKYAALLPQQATATTTAPPAVSIRFVPTSPSMINPGEYREAIAGQVMLGSRGYAGARVAPFIVDVGGTGGARNGRPVVADQFGNFNLDISDVTVPASVRRRNIEVVIQDPMTAAEVYRQLVTINKPWTAGATQFGAGVTGVGNWFGRTFASPFRAIGQAWHNRQLRKGQIAGARAQAKAQQIAANAQAKSQRIAAKSQGYQAKQQAKAQAYQVKLARKQANAQAKAQAKAQRQQAKAAARAARAAAGGQQIVWWPFIIAFVLLLLAGVGLVWRWPVLWIGAPPLAVALMIYGGELRRDKRFWIRRMAWGVMSTLWLAVAILVVAADK